MRKIPTLIIAAAIILVPVLGGSVARAASGGSFQAGRIMDDSIFFKTNLLSVNDIQTFLNSKMPSCDTNGTQNVSYWYNSSTGYASTTSRDGTGNDVWTTSSRAQYSQLNGVSTPFTCLNNYHADIPTFAADNYCDALSATSNASSAQIIYNISQACGVNSEVLIVLLQKEQALVTDDWPWPVEYQYATGFCVYDNPADEPASCQGTDGFVNQLYYAARQFKKYESNPGAYVAGRTQNIAYSPEGSCGSSAVYLQTNATAFLYDYTPYQPDTAALNNLYGDGDSCSSYGNRNFWRYFNDWFGPTTSDSDANTINFIRLNHSSGHVEIVGYSSISDYSVMNHYYLSSYPAVTPDGAVYALINPTNNNLSFVRLNHSSGHVEIVTYSASSGYTNCIDYELTAYPAVAPDGNVIPLFTPSGNLAFVRLNHSSGHVEIVTYSASSGYHQLIDYELTGYPDVAADGAVIPLFSPNGNLNFIRLNHSSGHVEIVSYSPSSGYKTLVDHSFSSYPAVAPDGAVVPRFTPTGNLSFIRLNHSSGHVEVVTYSPNNGYQDLIDYELTAYPAVTPDGAVIPIFSR